MDKSEVKEGSTPEIETDTTEGKAGEMKEETISETGVLGEKEAGRVVGQGEMIFATLVV